MTNIRTIELMNPRAACGFSGTTVHQLSLVWLSTCRPTNDAGRVTTIPAPMNETHMRAVLTSLFFTVGCLRNVVFAEKVVESFRQKLLYRSIGILRLNQPYRLLHRGREVAGDVDSPHPVRSRPRRSSASQDFGRSPLFSVRGGQQQAASGAVVFRPRGHRFLFATQSFSPRAVRIRGQRHMQRRCNGRAERSHRSNGRKWRLERRRRAGVRSQSGQRLRTRPLSVSKFLLSDERLARDGERTYHGRPVW
jgi:hypothetical protein